jgi:hypothetical protein
MHFLTSVSYVHLRQVQTFLYNVTLHYSFTTHACLLFDNQICSQSQSGIREAVVYATHCFELARRDYPDFPDAS